MGHHDKAFIILPLGCSKNMCVCYLDIQHRQLEQQAFLWSVHTSVESFSSDSERSQKFLELKLNHKWREFILSDIIVSA